MISVFLFLHSSFFNIEKISITGLETVTEDEVLALSGLSTGINIFELDKELLGKAIKIHPMVKNTTITRHLPGEIEVEVEERQIWALVPYDDLVLCIDDEGFCIDKKRNFFMEKYLIITMDNLPERINLGQLVEAEGINAIKSVWDEMDAKAREQISNFHYISGDKEILIYTREGTEVRFGKAERIQEKVNFLGQIFEIEKDLQEEGTDALEYVDMRFKGQPVVKTRA